MPACSERRGSECSLCYNNSIVCSSVVAFVPPYYPDVCVVPFMCRLLRKGKETMAGIVRQRQKAISVPLSATQRDCDAFGFHPVAVHELERLRSAEQSAAYQRVANAAEKKLAIKRARCSATGVCVPCKPLLLTGEGCGSAFRSGRRFNQQRCFKRRPVMHFRVPPVTAGAQQWVTRRPLAEQVQELDVRPHTFFVCLGG